jgi:hypothetical protein
LLYNTPRLAEKIRIARVNKERATQLKDNAQIKTQQQEYDAAFNLYVQRSGAAAAAQVCDAQLFVHLSLSILWIQ